MGKNKLNSNKKLPPGVQLKDNSDSSEMKSETIDNLVSQLSRLSKEYTDIVNSAISKNLAVVNNRIRITEDIFSQLLSSMSKGMQDNVVLTKDLLKCNGLLDLALLQRKMFEIYCTNMMNSSIEVARNIRKFE
ncbi:MULTISPECIES: hypothetical protein [unclassified Candidatus Tisiphia]|uniref:hypothetical protein n=1 Tax=unclassified Candidatus Tisiphia TaxID=2996318 RepID=UPI001E7B373E|nr:MAG: hypothetical protein LF884_03850 [Rickettsia endosymbiont of Cimex lectularius]